MQVSDINKEDGIACANLISLVKSARWANMSSEDAEHLLRAKEWLRTLAVMMAEGLKSKPVAPAAPAATGGFKIKAMGPIAGAKPRKKKAK